MSKAGDNPDRKANDMSDISKMARKFGRDYSDMCGRPAMLTDDEIRFFDEAVRKVLAATGLQIEVETQNHEKLDGKFGDAIGIHWKSDDDEFITIDTEFIHDMYTVEHDDKWYLSALYDHETLESVICHELAHMKYRNHTKYHADLTAKYIQMCA